MRIWQVDDDFEIQYEQPRITNEELQREYNYFLADQLTKKLLDTGLITEDEYRRIRKRNIKSFKPFFSKLMPDE